MSSDKQIEAAKKFVASLTGEYSMPADAYVALAELRQALAAHEAEKQAGPVAGLPERDTEKPAEQQGVFRKFEVRRVDGSDAPGGKHHGCEYFVLDVDHDPCAPAALAAYADAVEATHPVLAQDMRQRYGLYTAPPSPLAEQDKVDAELTPEFLEAVRATADELLRGNAGLGAMRQAALWLQDFYLSARAKKEQP